MWPTVFFVHGNILPGILVFWPTIASRSPSRSLPRFPSWIPSCVTGGRWTKKFRGFSHLGTIPGSRFLHTLLFFSRASPGKVQGYGNVTWHKEQNLTEQGGAYSATLQQPMLLDPLILILCYFTTTNIPAFYSIWLPNSKMIEKIKRSKGLKVVTSLNPSNYLTR